MKIEIDLNDILGDEDGAETLQDSVRRQVVEKLTKTIRDGVGRKIDEAVSAVISEEMQKAVQEQMPALVDDLLNAEYQPVTSWGERQGKTTFRAELVKSITTQMKYEPKTYSSEENAFTRAVKSVIETKMSEFRVAFNKRIDDQFIADAMKFATDKLAERLGVKK